MGVQSVPFSMSTRKSGVNSPCRLFRGFHAEERSDTWRGTHSNGGVLRAVQRDVGDRSCGGGGESGAGSACSKPRYPTVIFLPPLSAMPDTTSHFAA